MTRPEEVMSNLLLQEIEAVDFASTAAQVWERVRHGDFVSDSQGPTILPRAFAMGRLCVSRYALP